ncbi:type III pantothenate kinase [Anaerococcus tetradius]|uniref:type III pantothenate kinase n=1 Tax=Anaerococcus tetradius TaxID=33036 RepID=UPI0023F1243F|nr:type III pantothenate kinase [Anaerococcus tetradius]
MLLAIDIENRKADFGLFDKDKMLYNFSIKSNQDRSANELSLLIKLLLREKNINSGEIDDLIISSVVPEVDRTYEEVSKLICGKSPIFISAGLKIGINIKYDNPKDVGSDRIIRAVGGKKLYKDNIVIISASSITTIDYINSKKEFLGGVIMPGASLFQESLAKESAKLFQVEIKKSDKILGNSTTKAMQKGIYFAYQKAISAIVEEIIKENDLDIKETTIISTGEFAKLLDDDKYKIQEIPYLGLFGLKTIYDLNTSIKNS